MFKELNQIQKKPEVFSVYTTDTLWTEPHLAEQMLQAHLSQETPMASRPLIAIDRVVTWLDKMFELNGKSICDLGCGPGLYAEKYASLGAKVHGVDFSNNSIQYAKKSASERQLDITYQVANYLEKPLPSEQDLVTLIYCDLCALSPTHRQKLYSQIRDSLKPDGTFVFDVFSTSVFSAFTEHCSFATNYMNKFWSNNKYHTFHNAFRYEDESTSLDHYTIIEEERIWHVYNWMQYFTHTSIRNELADNGFEIIEIVNGFDTDELNDSSFGVIAKLKS
ncbi:class I SAM-dependent methyltransferase [Shewanella donghaensis]|uniref:class I SAM-dependent methyltransferase n=1 Tax=Shewanella donghaensis TaxID=238836 RepID=UPI00118386D8|nr:class I SAM-dependent methyltransferase [Shewanella donghaensis]